MSDEVKAPKPPRELPRQPQKKLRRATAKLELINRITTGRYSYQTLEAMLSMPMGKPNKKL